MISVSLVTEINDDKECFLITTYCDTEEKVGVLRDTLESLKKYNLDICVHAHYPLPVDIQQKIKYYIYDKSNPIIPFGPRGIIVWRKMQNLQLNILKRDYGYTVVSQWKQGLLFLYGMGYNKVHVLNYDAIVSDENIEKSKQNYSGIFYLKSDDEINLLFSTVRISDYLDVINSMSEEDYIFMNEYWFAEKYFFNKFRGNNLFIREEISHRNIRHQPYELDVYKFEDYNIHFGERINWINGEKIYTDKYTFMFYNVNKNIDFKIFKGFSLYYHEEVDSFSIIDTDITTTDIKQNFGYWSGNEFVNGNNQIKILINDKVLDDNITSNFCISAIEFDV